MISEKGRHPHSGVLALTPPRSGGTLAQDASIRVPARLGYMLMNAIGLHNVDVIMAMTFLLTVFAAVVSGILLAIDRQLHRRG
jgi:hypothetical protein